MTWRPYVLLFLLLAGLAVAKSAFDPMLGRRSTDASYYMQIAQHVRDGDGLVTHVSLYHQGFKSFPHATNQSPIWLLALGYSGRVVDLDWAATQIPEALYLLDLLLLYFVARRLWERTGADGWLFRRGRLFDFGHFAVLLLGLNPVFFRFTSLPYNEPLGFTFFFAALLALDRADVQRSARWAVCAGALGCLALLTRAQLLGVALAVPAALVLSRGFQREGMRLGGAAALGALLPLIPWVIYLATWMDDIGFRTVIGLAEIRETTELAVFESAETYGSMGERLRDYASGLAVAFSPWSEQSYLMHMSYGFYLIVAGALYLLATLRTDPTGLSASTRASLWWALLIATILVLGPVHVTHNVIWRDWLFGHRHGMAISLFALPVVAALDRSRHMLLPQVAALLIAASFIPLTLEISDVLQRDTKWDLRKRDRQLLAWVNAQDPLPVLISTRAQKLAPFTKAGLHWVGCDSSAQETEALIEHAGADYVVVELPRQRHCSFSSGRLQEVTRFGNKLSAMVVLRHHASR